MGTNRCWIAIADVAKKIRFNCSRHVLLHIRSRSTPAPKNSSSALAVSNPDMGPQSNPSARAAIMKYVPCSVRLRLLPRIFKYLAVPVVLLSS
jgi:hypothetical protein